jgi:hypothetical protein
MNGIQATALARLRAADPASRRTDPSDPYAHAMLERVLAAADAPARSRARPIGRWIGVGAVGAAAVTAASVLAATTPWSQGQAASAYTVDTLPNGSLSVTIQLRQLQDPTQLNAELQRENAHTVALRMLPANQCSDSPSTLIQFAEPAPNSSDRAAALQQVVSWTTHDETESLIIDPQKIPLNETLVVAYAVYQLPHGWAERVIPRIVSSVPRCLPAPPAPSAPMPTPGR